MLSFSLATLILVLSLTDAVPKSLKNKNSPYYTVENIQSNGYKVEVHHVTTSDGYILEMHRIPEKRDGTGSTERKPVVFAMHGLLSASNAFVYISPEYGIGYNLADAGCDVWLGNARGNRHSRHHVTLDPDNEEDKPKFFDISLQDISRDIAAMVDYVLEVTDREKLHYIGHSQGGSTFMILNSQQTEYNEKFASAHLLGAAGYSKHFPNSLLMDLSNQVDSLYNLAKFLKIYELFPPNTTGLEPRDGNIYKYCSGNIQHADVCARMPISGGIIDIMLEDGHSGAALKQIVHFAQTIRDGIFKAFDYGPEENMNYYNSEQAHSYDLTKITVNTTFHYTVADSVVGENDSIAMAADMPNAVARRITDDLFPHEGFMTEISVKHLVTDYMIEAIFNAEPVYEYHSNHSSILAATFSTKLCIIVYSLIIMLKY